MSTRSIALRGLALMAALLLLPAYGHAQEKRTCPKTFRVMDTSGKVPEGRIKVTKFFYDWKPGQRDNPIDPVTGKVTTGPEEFEYRKYVQRGYEAVGPASKKMDCAGYVMNTLWSTGPYRVDSVNLFEHVIQPFGTKVSSLLDWGDVKPNDILSWSEPSRHVAIVKAVEHASTPNPRAEDLAGDAGRKNSLSKIVIETKDGDEKVYRKALDLGMALTNEDPLAQYGTRHIWRVDPSRIKLLELFPGECDPIDSGPKIFTLTATYNEPRDDKYYRVSPDVYVMKAGAPGEPQVEFKLNGQVPKDVNPGDTFPLRISGSVQNAKNRYGVVLRWYEDGYYMRSVGPESLWIGIMDLAKNQITPSGAAEFKVEVPKTQGKELQLRVEYGIDFNAEVSWHDWLTFVYTRKP